MDIPNAAFPLELLKILQEVAESHFIAFDLEFSGVASRRPPGPGKSGKLSLQEYYEDIKAAAEKYQILQVGFTIVKQDLKKGRYIARPYNFNISPLTSLRERHFGREWSYHSGAIAFLTRNGFKFDLPITSGVQYLSRSEERVARQNIINEEDARAKLADMDLKPEDNILIQHIRSSLSEWQSQPKDMQEDYLNIPTEEPTEEAGVPQQLNRYQVRLTHQIVRNEYPSLKTQGMGHFVQVTNPTDDQQASQKLAMVENRERDIAKTIGFRWLFEGITGGNILGIPDEYIIGGLPTVRLDGKPPKEYLQNLQQKLKARPKILVGHNCFTDFVNLYKCFIGPLPDTVEGFASAIHDLFPGVVDTKSLASFGHKRWGNTSLEDVENDLMSQEKPKIHVPAEYDRYTVASMYHEVGYDSLLTAKIAIKLSAKLEREKEYIEKLKHPEGAQVIESFGADEDEFHESNPEPVKNEASDGSLVQSISRTLLSPVNTVKALFDKDQAASSSPPSRSQETNPKPSDRNLGAAVAIKEPARSWSEKDEIEKIKKTLDRTNIYDVLGLDEGGPDFGKSDGSMAMDNNPRSGGSVERSDILKMQAKGDIMPMWDNKVFWTLFGNKLQVNGSKEGVLKLE